MSKKTAIFGAGQAGRMAFLWLPSDADPVCYIDNNPGKQGTEEDGLPVVSLDAALLMEIDVILIAVLNRDAEAAIRKQIASTTFSGVCISLSEIQKIQNIRLAALRLAAKEIRERKIKGDMAELGVYRGDFSAEMNRLLPEKRLWLFDTFEGFDRRDLESEKKFCGERKYYRDFSDTDLEKVRKKFRFPDQAVFIKGFFPESLEQISIEQRDSLSFSLVSLDPDLYEPTYRGLCFFYPRLSKGGRILIHDYTSSQFEGVHLAVDRYCREHDLFVVPLMDLHGSAVLVKD